jgi:hypothetical protein
MRLGRRRDASASFVHGGAHSPDEDSDGIVRCDGADFDMLSNIHDALFPVFRDEGENALQTGMKNMREFLKENRRGIRRCARS